MSKNLDAHEAWQRLANPVSLTDELVLVSLMNLAYELLKDSIVDQIRDFYSLDFVDGKMVPSTSYRDAVLARDKSPLFASLNWLRDRGAIEDQDIAILETFREHRNQVIHELLAQLSTSRNVVDSSIVANGLRLMRKIDTWFILHVHVPSDPEFDEKPVEAKDVASGRMFVLALILGAINERGTDIEKIREALKVENSQ